MASCDKIVPKDSVNPSSEIIDKVLCLELLREMILDYVIHGEEKNKTNSNIRSCRLVCKDWLRSVSRVLLNCQEPLFWVKLSDAEEDKADNGKRLNEFVIAVTGPCRLDDRVPPFAITANYAGILQEHCQSFFNCLVQCGGGLVELCLRSDHSELPLILDTDLFLPKLKKVRFGFFGIEKENWSTKVGFIQSIFNACEQLQSCELRDCSGHSYLCYPFEFPSSVTELMLHRAFPRNAELNLGKNICLPPLQKLQLNLSDVPLKDGLITSILEQVKKSLKSVDILVRGCSLDNQPTTFRFPLMEKLEKFKIQNEYLELEQNFSSLEQLVPVLSDIYLSKQTVSAFRKLTDRSCFHSVTSLAVSLSSLERIDTDDVRNREVNFDQCTLASMKRAFPNLQKLDIMIYDEDTAIFVFIMKEMKHLQYLGITARDSYGAWGNKHADLWSALLLGIPLESVAALTESPELWEENLRVQSTASIRNLNDLRTLYISCGYGSFELSSAVFHHAFLKMPNLINLEFEDNLRVSTEMQQVWSEHGGNLLSFNLFGDDAEDSEEDEMEDAV